MADQLPKTMYDAVMPALRTAGADLLRGAFAYIRANPNCTVAQVGAYVNTLTLVLTIGTTQYQNSQVLTWWIGTHGLTNAQALQLAKDLPDDVLIGAEPGVRPMPSKARHILNRLVGSLEWGYSKAEDFTEPVPTRDPDRGNYVVSELYSGTVDGSPRQVRVNYSVTLNVAERRWVTDEGTPEVVL